MIDCMDRTRCDGLALYASDGYQYIEDHGLMDAESYPYTGTRGHCNYDGRNVVNTRLKSYIWLSSSYAAGLKEDIFYDGPIETKVAASSSVFKFYKNGIIPLDEVCSGP